MYPFETSNKNWGDGRVCYVFRTETDWFLADTNLRLAIDAANPHAHFQWSIDNCHSS